MERFIYSEGTYGTVLYRKSAEELWLEALAKPPTMEISWIDCDTGRKNVLLQVDDQVWVFDFRNNEDTPWSYTKGERK